MTDYVDELSAFIERVQKNAEYVPFGFGAYKLYTVHVTGFTPRDHGESQVYGLYAPTWKQAQCAAIGRFYFEHGDCDRVVSADVDPKDECKPGKYAHTCVFCKKTYHEDTGIMYGEAGWMCGKCANDGTYHKWSDRRDLERMEREWNNTLDYGWDYAWEDE